MGRVGALLLRSALLAFCLFIIGLLANALRPRGIVLSRNYFPLISPAEVVKEEADAGALTNEAGVAQRPGKGIGHSAESEMPKAAGSIRVIGIDETRRLWEEAKKETGLILFLDARSPQAFVAGHIPGARLFYHYRAEDYLPEVLPLCELAQVIVIYCSGGNCEDSRFAAGTLIELGVPQSKIRLFGGGFKGWVEAGMPIERATDLGAN